MVLLLLMTFAAVYDLYAPTNDPIYDTLELRRLVDSEELRLLFWHNGHSVACFDNACDTPRRLNDTHILVTTPQDWRCDPRAAVIGVFNKEAELCALFPSSRTTCPVAKHSWTFSDWIITRIVAVLSAIWLVWIFFAICRLRWRPAQNQFHRE